MTKKSICQICGGEVYSTVNRYDRKTYWVHVNYVMDMFHDADPQINSKLR